MKIIFSILLCLFFWTLLMAPLFAVLICSTISKAMIAWAGVSLIVASFIVQKKIVDWVEAVMQKD